VCAIDPAWTAGIARRFSARLAGSRGLRRVVELAAEACPEAFDRDPRTGKLAMIDESARHADGKRQRAERTNLPRVGVDGPPPVRRAP
jgi:hypothetical protein